MRKILIVILILSMQNTYGQQLEVYGGANMNRYFDVYGYAGHFMRDYQSGFGYSIGTGINSGYSSKFNTRFAMQFDYYRGAITAEDGTNGSEHTTKAGFKKSVISFMISPLNYKVFNKIEFNLSPVFSLLVDESFFGTSSGWEMYEGGWSHDLNDIYDEYSANCYFGLQARIAYELKLTNKVSITPQYLYYIGLSNEFIYFPEITKSMRFYLGLAVKMNLVGN